MAITKYCSRFLFFSKKLGVSFSNTLMLGRLQLYATKEDIQKDITLFGTNEKTPAEVNFRDEYAEPLFEILGAKEVNSLDFSNYEGASIIHDLNLPLPEKYFNSFTAIVDGGTLEHVFNFPVAIKNCMKALRIGGHYLGITPVNNSMGHGFYQFSPELYYRIFSEENGFAVKKMLITAGDENGELNTWYEVADPKTLKSRVTLINNSATYLMVIAQKVEEKDIFSTIPQQSDYTLTWAVSGAVKNNSKPAGENRLKWLYRKIVPRRIKIILRNMYDLITKEKLDTVELGTVNPEHFKKTDIFQK